MMRIEISALIRVRQLILFGVLLVLMPLSVSGKPPSNVKFQMERDGAETPKDFLILPYGFTTEDMGTNFGIGGMAWGYYQDQLAFGGTYFGTDSEAFAIGMFDFSIAKNDRWFLTIMAMNGNYPQMRAHAPETDRFLAPDAIRPGSNDSPFDDFIGAEGRNDWSEIILEYVLPIGAAKESPILDYHVVDGALVSGSSQKRRWNPLESGVTLLTIRQFNRFQQYQTTDEFIEGAIHPIELGILYDNTDFVVNPSSGSSQYLAITHDFAWADSEREWTFIELEASKYWSFGESEWARQRTIAWNFWTAYSPTWDLEFNDQGESRVIDHPPFLEGATLGGFYRMRGYDSNRFHDKAAIYTTLEYRYTFKDNPVEEIEWMDVFGIDWFQLVAFIEGGRVSPTYHRDELFSDWKSDAGFSLRFLATGLLVRLDVAHSEEGNNTWVMVSHPF